MSFITYIGTAFKIKFNRKVIWQYLIKAGYRQSKIGNSKFYTIPEIEQNIDCVLTENLFKIYSKECFIYKETNRRLNKYLLILPPDIFSEENRDKIQELILKDRAFQKLVPVFPFIVEMNKQIAKLNSPGFFNKDLRFTNGTLYRGVKFSETQIEEFRNSIGQNIGFPAFSSTSQNIDIALTFASSNTLI